MIDKSIFFKIFVELLDCLIGKTYLCGLKNENR